MLGAVAFSSQSIAQTQSAVIQKQTISALKAADKGQWTNAKTIIAKTKDPLAAKLYYWMRFTKKSNIDNYTALAQFIRKNPDWPRINALSAKAEKAMPDTLSNAQIIAWFSDYEPKTAKGLDRYLGALISSGRKNEAQKIIRKWWADISLTRDEQRAIYRIYGYLIDRAAHTRRLDALLFRKQYTNARGIAGVLGGGYSALTEARIALAAKKSDVNALIAKVPQSLKNDPGLLYERLKWRRQNDFDVGAMEILNNAPPANKIQNPKEWWRERHIMIRRLLEKKHYKSAYILASGHRQTEGFPMAQAEWMSGWIALRFVNKPREAYEHFQKLYSNVESPISKARGAYWSARAAEKSRHVEDADKWYRNAAQYQTVYYGQLAGAKLGLKESLPNAAPPPLTAQDLSAYRKNELVQAAKLFHAAGIARESAQFMNAFIAKDETPKSYRYAAELTGKMRRHYDAVRISKNATKKGLFLTSQAYPVVTNKLGNVKTEWALVHGIIRQESMFDYKARSHAGALGLMQLMPATAKETARKIGISHQNSWLTSRPDHNIRLGSEYLNRMLARYDGAYPMAIAAYNAGPGRVDRWLKEFGDPRIGEITWIDWIELMPIYETRNYVQRVMEAIYVYRLRLKNIQKPAKLPIHVDFYGD